MWNAEIKINKKCFWGGVCFLFLLPFFEPGIVINYSIFHNIHYLYVMARWGITAVISLFAIALGLKTLEVWKCITLVGLLCIELVMITIFRDGELLSVINYLVTIVGLCMLAYVYVIMGNFYVFLKSLSATLTILIWMNFLLLIIMPEGFYTSYGETFYFLGHSNNTMRFAMPAVLVSMLCDKMETEKIRKRTKILAIISLLTVVITHSITGLFGCGAMFVFAVLMNGNLPKTITAVKALLISIGTFLFFVVFRFQYLFEYFFISVLGKDLSLTNRTDFWDKGMEYIVDSVMIGYGYIHDYAPYIRYANGYVPSSLHNFYLDILMRGGILHLVTFIILFIVFCQHLKQRKEHHTTCIYVYGFLVYSVIWNFDPFIWDGISLLILFLLLPEFEDFNNRKIHKEISHVFNRNI